MEKNTWKPKIEPIFGSTCPCRPQGSLGETHQKEVYHREQKVRPTWGLKLNNFLNVFVKKMTDFATAERKNVHWFQKIVNKIWKK